jgi:hypothetical protein
MKVYAYCLLFVLKVCSEDFQGDPAVDHTYTLGVATDIASVLTTSTFVVPEFPVNLMVIAGAGLIGTLIATRLKRNTLHERTIII